MNILCSLVVPESFSRPFLFFSLKPVQTRRWRSGWRQNALNGEKYLDSVSTEMFKEISLMIPSILKNQGRPHPEHLRLLYDIYNKFFKRALTKIATPWGVKIENPRSEDLPFLIKQLKFNTNLYATLNKKLSILINIKKTFNCSKWQWAITLIGRWSMA